MARQQEENSGGPMLPKTMITYLDAQNIVDDATGDYLEKSAAEMTHSDVTETAADPKSTMSSATASDSWTLPAGKWLVEVCLSWANAATTGSSLDVGLTNEVNSSSVTIFGQTSLAQSWVTPASIGEGTAMFSFVAHVTAHEPEATLRVTNSGSASATMTILAGSHVRFTKISNKYDS